MNNCEKCMGAYAPYKVGEKEDVGAKWCEFPTGKWIRNWKWLWLKKKFVSQEPKGLCQFHNPKSKLFITT
jgi:hypothetical protein